MCAVNYLPVKSPVTHETGAWERGTNRDDAGAPVKETASVVTASSKWKRRQEEARLAEGRTTSSLRGTWSWEYMGLRCREQGEVTPHPPRDTEVDQSYGNGWNHPRKAHRERREKTSTLFSTAKQEGERQSRICREDSGRGGRPLQV